jgi:addiction module HigA family antidote
MPPAHREFRDDETRPLHPGMMLKRSITEYLGISVEEAAQRMGMYTHILNDIIDGRLDITEETAKKISTLSGSTTEFWLRMQVDFKRGYIKFSTNLPRYDH